MTPKETTLSYPIFSPVCSADFYVSSIRKLGEKPAIIRCVGKPLG
jgi:hypothetical protein